MRAPPNRGSFSNKHDLVATACRRSGGLHACRSPADHDDLLSDHGCRKVDELRLPARDRVDRAASGPREIASLRKAPVAPNTWPYARLPTRPRLSHAIGIRDDRADHGDHVGFVLRDDLLGHVHGDGTDRGHRDAQLPLETLRIMDIDPARKIRGLDHSGTRTGNIDVARRYVQQIDLVLDHPGELDGVVDRRRARNEFVGAQSILDSRDHHLSSREPPPAPREQTGLVSEEFPRSGLNVVRDRGEEAAQQVTMTPVDHDHFHPRVLAAGGCIRRIGR